MTEEQKMAFVAEVKLAQSKGIKIKDYLAERGLSVFSYANWNTRYKQMNKIKNKKPVRNKKPIQAEIFPTVQKFTETTPVKTAGHVFAFYGNPKDVAEMVRGLQ